MLFLLFTLVISHKPNPEGTMNFIEICHYHNYPVQEHHIITEDGYYLTIYRVQAKNT